jgi:dTDP-4-dehydrorhamnose 3,5-epimerase
LLLLPAGPLDGQRQGRSLVRGVLALRAAPAELESNKAAFLLKKVETSLPGVWELRSDVFRDARGFFMETYHQATFAALGISDIFVQDNHSCSVRGTLRGLHYQLRYPQAKLCRVAQGKALDVAVDIRTGSPYFGKWTGVLLSAETQNQVYIPRGFAHGFLALTETVQFLYKCSDFYDPADEYGVIWDDPDLAICWGISQPLVSQKDTQFRTLASVPPDLLPRYPAK